MAYGVLNAKISAQIDEFERNMDRASGKLDDVGNAGERGGTKASKGLATLAKAAGIAAVAIGVVTKKMGDMVMSSATALDRVDKLSQKIGLSRVAFQEWDYILGQSGASVEGLQMGLKTLSNAADEARKGTALYAESFDRLGISVVDVNGNMKDQETLFNEVFVALANIDNQTERTAIANKLLGRSATELAAALNTSKEEIEQLRKEAHDLGVVYSDEVVDAGVLLGDNIERLTKAFDGLKTKALAPIIGLAVTFTEKLLGQDSASKNLKTTYDNLKTAVSNYNTILEESKGKTDAITQSMVSQAKAQMQLALQSASEAYRKSSSELEKYNNTIQNSEKWIGKYEKSLSQIAQGTGYTTEQLNLMTEQERLTAIAMAKGVEEGDRYNAIVLARKRYQEDLIKATTNLSQAEANQESFINLLTQGYIAENEAVRLLLDTYPELEQKVLNNVEAYEKEQKAIADRNKAIQLATTAFKAYENASQEALERLINLNRANKDSAYSTELVRLATEKLNEVLAEKAKKTEDEIEKERLRNEIIENSTTAMQTAEQYALALGDSFNLNAEKASILETAIKALIDTGLGPASEEVQGLVDKLTALGSAMETPTGGGEDDPEDTGTYYEDELDRLREFVASEQDILIKRRDDRLAFLKDALEKQKVTQEEFNELEKQIKEKHENDLTDIQKKAQEERNQLLLNAGTMMANNLISIYSNLVDATEKEGKRNFQLQKAASIAQAVIDGISAGISSYKAGSAIGGPVVGAAFAATSAAATGAMIAKLASASYGGGSSASVPTPSATTPAIQSQQTLLVQGDFDSSQLFSGSAVRDLIDKIGEAQKDGYTVVMA